MFNWPLGRNSARVNFGLFSVEDYKYKFRFGVIKKDEKDKIYGPQEWLGVDEMNKVGKFDVEMGDIILVKKRNIETEKVLSYEFDIRKYWPNNASGGTSVNMPWTI